MLAPLVLPVQITVAIFAVALVVVGLRSRSDKAVVRAVLLAFLLFIPSCLGISAIVDACRYGRFEYAAASEINDPDVEIPRTATSITLHKFASGHTVRFQANADELHSWMDAVTERRKQFADAVPFERDEERIRVLGQKFDWDRDFGRQGWPMPGDIVRYKGWRSGRGAGFDVWYSPATETGYLSAAYW